jgi:hypothetical protein
VRKVQRPAAARLVGDGMKLHRRTIRCGRSVFTVVSLRPGATARFSTAYEHDTWHVLSDAHGGRLLAHLLWGLSFQARPGTLVLIDRPFLVPAPFDAARPAPIVVAPTWCTPFDTPTAARLSRCLPLRGAPEGTVRWRTFGLARKLQAERREAEMWPAPGPGAGRGLPDLRPGDPEHGRVDRMGGIVTLLPASVRECRSWALQAARLDPREFGTAVARLSTRRHHGYEGEIQLFQQFQRLVDEAERARRRTPDRPIPLPDYLPRRLIPAKPAPDPHLRIFEWQLDKNGEPYRRVLG